MLTMACQGNRQGLPKAGLKVGLFLVISGVEKENSKELDSRLTP